MEGAAGRTTRGRDGERDEAVRWMTWVEMERCTKLRGGRRRLGWAEGRSCWVDDAGSGLGWRDGRSCRVDDADLDLDDGNASGSRLISSEGRTMGVDLAHALLRLSVR